MTTIEEVKASIKKYNMSGDIYLYRCCYCNNILVSRLKNFPKYCTVCRIHSSESDFVRIPLEALE